MIGAWHRMLAMGAPRPIVVAMVGTAVTVEAIDASGKFLGGYILPGHGIMLRALESGTAGLHVPTGEVRPFPTNTSDALTSGGTYAIAGAMERMVQHCARPLRRRALVRHGRWRRLEDGTQPVHALRVGGHPDLRRTAADRRAPRFLQQGLKPCARLSAPAPARLRPA